MLRMLTYLSEAFATVHPTRDVALSSARHLSKAERKKLFSQDIEPMRTAEGRWFEAIVYEMMLRISMNQDLLAGIVRKGADARAHGRVQMGQNGLFYSRNGDINIRGNGQDLAEVDLLLLDRDRRVAFAEIVTSPLDMKDFEEEIHYKKRLLGYLFAQEIVPFILVSSVDISRISVVRRLLRSPENVLICTRSCEEIKKLTSPADIRNVPRKPVHHPKLISATELSTAQPFDYRVLHDRERERVINAIVHEHPVDRPVNPRAASQLVKKILFGGLYPSAVKTICAEYPIVVKGKAYDAASIERDFSKAVLAADLPGYDPIIYLRSKKKKEYLKMVESKAGGFKFERYTPDKVGFFLWLESLRPTLGAHITRKILAACLKHPMITCEKHR